MGVNAIELPVLTESKEDEIIYRTICESIKNAIVKIPVGASEQDVEKTFLCVKNAHALCLQVVMPVSTAQMEYAYHLKAPAMKEKIAVLVKKAREYSERVEFVALDAFRAEDGFVVDCAKTAVECGASCVTLCDDAGDAFPEDYTNMVSAVKAVCGAKIFVKPSNKLALSASLALSAIKAGADGVVTSVCGDYLCPSVIAEITRAKKYDLDADCDIDVTNVKVISQNINGVACDKIQGVEQTAFNGNIETSASMADVANVIKQLGYELSDSDIGKVYEEFKKLST
jgi:2-isopropylmalate synthase